MNAYKPSKGIPRKGMRQQLRGDSKKQKFVKNTALKMHKRQSVWKTA